MTTDFIPNDDKNQHLNVVIKNAIHSQILRITINKTKMESSQHNIMKRFLPSDTATVKTGKLSTYFISFFKGKLQLVMRE